MIATPIRLSSAAAAILLGIMPSAAIAQAGSAVAAVRTAVMATCYPMIGGGDLRAADASLSSGDLKPGAPEGFPADILESLMQVPGGGKAEAFHVVSGEGKVLVVAAPDAGSCSVALIGHSGEAAGLEIDGWFNGSPSPFTQVQNNEGPGGWSRIYDGAEAASRPTRVLTTIVRDGYRPDVPVRFLATLHRITD